MGLKNPKRIAEILASLNARAPLSTAEDWDNVGLLLGDPQQTTRGAVISVDLTFEAVQAAVDQKFNLIINHHPCIFPKSRGLSRVIAGTPIFEALRHGISVAAYHSNFDQCALEVVQAVAEGLGVKSLGRLSEKGLAKGSEYGFWGDFPEPRPFSDFSKDVKTLFNVNGFWITNPIPTKIRRIGFAAGKGASFVDSASEKKCDVFITGETGYHVALGAARTGMAVMELGHKESECFFGQTMKRWLSDLNLDLEEVQTPTQQIFVGGT